MENLLNVLFPPKCVFCNKTGSVFCPTCLAQCQILEQNLYFLHIRASNKKINVWSPFDYDGNVRQCIKLSKYGARRFAALKTLSELGALYTHNMGIRFDDFIVVPIPLNKRKYRSRGFNQAEIIAEILANKFKLKLNASILKRSKNTEVQFKFNRKARFENLKNAFEANPLAKSQKILLVDDICTTGATLSEAASVLYKCGAEDVRAYTLSRRL
jgi:competence protein ComFC